MTDARVALVTGGGSGIGLATASALSVEGYAVALVDLVPFRGDGLAGLSSSSEPLILRADVSKREEIAAAVAATLDRYGRLDVLVTCAGHIELVPIAGLTDETLRRMLAVHLEGTIFTIQAALDAMRRRRYGRIVCISSAAAVKGVVAHSHYAAAKAGIVGFAKSAARELGPDGITINCILPGAIDTPLLGALPPEELARLSHNPVGRIGTPEDVAHAVCFFASPKAGFVTGTTLLVTGGEYV